MKKLLLIPLFILCFSMLKAQTEVTFYTTKGIFVAEIYDNIVPITGGNFLDLVDTSFYDGVIFHRVIDNFMIQGGDPTGTGSGGPGYSIQDEFDPSLSNLQKTLSMANSGPNTGGSQFFINLVDNTYLDYNKAPLTSKHPVFGMVLMNFNIVQDIGKVPTNSTNNRPLIDVVMDSVRVGNGLTVGTEKPSVIRNTLSVIPNPVSEQSFLNINTSKQSTAVLSIYDDMGKLMALKDVSFTHGSNRIPLDDVVYSMKESGIYFLNLQIEGEYHSLKLMKE